MIAQRERDRIERNRSLWEKMPIWGIAIIYPLALVKHFLEKSE